MVNLRRAVATAVFLIFCVLLLPRLAAAQPYERMTLLIDYPKPVLYVLNEADQLVRIYPVALPKDMPPLPVEAWVEMVEMSAPWRPTDKTRRELKAQKGLELPELIPAGDRRNAMGVGKMHLRFFTPGVDPAVRIHGTNDPRSIGQLVTRDCYRLTNEDFLDLASVIDGKITFFKVK